MGLKECGKGHMYDDSQYKKCPYCQQTKAKRDYPHLFALFGKKTPETESPPLTQLYAGPPVEPTKKVEVPSVLYAGPPAPDNPSIVEFVPLYGGPPLTGALYAGPPPYEYTPYQEPHNALKQNTLLAGGKYRVGRAIKRDFQSFTYLSTDTLSQSQVIIKEYLPDGIAYRDWKSNFLQWYQEQEPSDWQDTKRRLAEIAAKVMRIERVPGIAWVRDVFFQNNTTYVVTDFKRGETLNKRIEKNGSLDVKNCFQLLCPLIDALESVHKNRVLHMDIEPENILIDYRGSACLLNLGILNESSPLWPWEKASSSGLSRFSPFAATETHFQKSDIGSWTDVYSMCATFFYAVTGTAPVIEINGLEHTLKDTQGTLSPAVHAILERGLAPDYRDRILSMKALREELGAAIQANE